MSIGALCNREVVCASRETTVYDAAQLMRQRHVGTLVVVDEFSVRRVPVGIVTDRDIVVEVNAVGLDPKTITLGDIMDEALVTVSEGAGLHEAMGAMRAKGVRRLPVVGKEGELVGILAVDDLLELLGDELSDVARIIAREQAHEARARR
ncbi:MAG TPA: CBS domain-containing protein [Burkholderiales bacterium]|nr:CBS domain-containing protein [Burkholderiales bacterium]